MLTISDKDFISNLVKELETSPTSSTSTFDIELPEYKLLFKNKNEIIFNIGYYNKVIKLGIKGQYLDFDEEIIYGLELPLPLD